jgi:hypothetical protein
VNTLNIDAARFISCEAIPRIDRIFCGSGDRLKLFAFKYSNFERIAVIDLAQNALCMNLYSDEFLLCGEFHKIEIIRTSDCAKIDTSQIEGVYRVLQIKRTSRSNEILLATEKGVFFATLFLNNTS